MRLKNVLEEIIAENFQNLAKNNIQNQETQWIPKKINLKKSTPKHPTQISQNWKQSKQKYRKH